MNTNMYTYMLICEFFKALAHTQCRNVTKEADYKYNEDTCFLLHN